MGMLFILLMFVGALIGGVGGYVIAKSEDQPSNTSARLYDKAAELMRDMVALNVVTTDEIPMLPPTIRKRVEDWLEEHRKHHEKGK